jgi:hypothetical protein
MNTQPFEHSAARVTDALRADGPVVGKERPILFSGPMVRAILAGTKTMTRRVVKPTSGPHTVEQVISTPDSLAAFIRTRCPYGVPGDRLFVRETGWQRPERTPRMMREGADTWERYYYDADGLGEGDHEQFKAWGFKRRPAIHMPRKYSRLTLEVLKVRVERLQEISEKDCLAEGVSRLKHVRGVLSKKWKHTDAFRELWDSINSKRGYGWNANPWVWVVEFKRV